MAAPSTPILDNFDRADGSPGANWDIAVQTYNVPPISGNALTWPQFPSARWNVQQFAASQEAYVKQVGTLGGVGLLLRWQNPNSGAESGYLVSWALNGNQPAEAFVWTSGAASARSLGFSNFIMDPGDIYAWATIIDHTIRLYGSADNLTWNLRQTWNDSTYGRTGYLGLFYSNNGDVGMLLDGFGGGSIGGTPILVPTHVAGSGRW